MKEPDNRVPLFGTWRKAYLAVTVAFLVEVAFFYFVSRHFS
jgi:hypothetical protein